MKNLLETFPEICTEWDYIKNTYNPKSIGAYSNMKVWWICKKCGCEWEASPHARTRAYAQKCPKCPRIM
jgi:hypothetical protein